MMRRRTIGQLLTLLLTLLWAVPAWADVTIGGACTGAAGQSAQAADGNNVVCISSVWQYPAYRFGNSSATCDATNAGIIRWTGAAFQGCNGSSWGSLPSSIALSGLVAATTTNSIDNANFAQTWAWGTLSTQTALTFTTSSITTGTLLHLSGTATAANAGTVLKVTTSEAGASYAIQAINGGTANTGYGVYALNNSTSGWGVYSAGTSRNYFAGDVGIGTASPAYRLEVYEAGNSIVGISTTAGASTSVSLLSDTYSSISSPSAPLGFTVGGVERIRIQASTGSVGIGTGSPAGKLHVLADSATANATVYGIFESGAMSATNTSGAVYGAYINPTLSHTTTVASATGVISVPQNTSTGTVDSMLGVYGAPQNTAGGAVTFMTGAHILPNNTSSGTVASMKGTTVIPTKSGTGAVTDMFGLYSRCDNTNATGAVTNCYGVYIATPVTTGVITNKYGVYQVDSATNNYFNGNVGIGTNNPQSALHVSDGKYAQFEDNNAGAPAAGDCDADTERGRLSIDTTNNRLYVCNGATRGWDYVALTN